jgi:hypothetical protein
VCATCSKKEPEENVSVNVNARNTGRAGKKLYSKRSPLARKEEGCILTGSRTDIKRARRE